MIGDTRVSPTYIELVDMATLLSLNLSNNQVVYFKFKYQINNRDMKNNQQQQHPLE